MDFLPFYDTEGCLYKVYKQRRMGKYLFSFLNLDLYFFLVDKRYLKKLYKPVIEELAEDF
jgi:hypothetical protein